jgi:uncharacterized protein
MPGEYEPTERTQVKRKRDRGSYDRDLVHAILDEALICHVGFATDGQPFVIPTIHARDGELLYLHGSPANRMLGQLAEGVQCCVTATLVDELVLARSARQHSMNYRSAVVFGTGREVTDPEEKQRGFRAVVEHIAPARSDEIRGPDERDLETTSLIAVEIEEASAKRRDDPPVDKERDLDSPYWAGLLPVSLTAGEPIPQPDLPPGVELPDHLRNWRRTSGGPPPGAGA